jgi:hypothetical protein
MSDDIKPPEYAEDGWESVLDGLSAKDQATMDERMRCEMVVRAEIEQGRLRGVPESAGVMIILHRIALAISNG